MNKHLMLVIALTCSFLAAASTTNIINIAELAICKNGTTNGWTVSGIDSYADKISIRLNDESEFLLSPEFEAPIRMIILKVKSSSQNGRQLAFFPKTDGDYRAENAVICRYSPNKDTYVEQYHLFPNDLSSSAFKIALTRSPGSNTGWGICYLAVITDDIKRFESPRSVTVNHIHTSSARISWPHNGLVNSYSINVFTTGVSMASATVHQNYDFELCKNPGTNDTQDRSADFAGKYPDFSAEKLYYPASSSGILRISSGSANGRLTHSGFPDYSRMGVEITAKRYPGDNNMSHVHIYYIDGEHHKTIGVIPIGDDFTTARIPLEGTPGGTSINFGNLDGFKSNRRFLIDKITFLKDYTGDSVTTNLVHTSSVSDGDHCRIINLQKSTDYSVTVTAIDTEGKPAKPSTPVTFKTMQSGDNFMIRYL